MILQYCLYEALLRAKWLNSFCNNLKLVPGVYFKSLIKLHFHLKRYSMFFNQRCYSVKENQFSFFHCLLLKLRSEKGTCAFGKAHLKKKDSNPKKMILDIWLLYIRWPLVFFESNKQFFNSLCKLPSISAHVRFNDVVFLIFILVEILVS